MITEKNYYSKGIPHSCTIEVDDDLTLRRPAIILCHGHARHKDDGLDCLAKQLADKGFFTMRINLSGCGSNERNRHELYCGQDWPQNLTDAISFAENFPMVDRSRVGVVGISMGGATVVYTTAMDRRIKSTAAIAPIADCGRWLRQLYENNGGNFDSMLERMSEDGRIASYTGNSSLISVYDLFHLSDDAKEDGMREAFKEDAVSEFVSLASAKSLLGYRPVEKADLISTPLLICYGSEDNVVPNSEGQELFYAAKSEKKIIHCYQGMEHNMLMDSKRESLINDIVEWFENTL